VAGRFFNQPNNIMTPIKKPIPSCKWAPLLVALIAGGETLNAQNWTGTVDGNWSVGTNWSNSVPATSGEAVTINGATAFFTSTINSTWATAGSVNSLAFTSNASSGTAFTVQSGSGVTSFGVGAGGITVAASTQTFNLNTPLTLSASQNWNVGAGSTLNIKGASMDYGSGVTVTKTGTGTLFLGSTAASTSAGNFVLNQGTLGVGITGSSQFGTNGLRWENNGNTNLQVGIFGTLSTNATFSNNVQLYDQGVGGGQYTFTSAAIASGSTFTISGNWSSANTLTQQITFNSVGNNTTAGFSNGVTKITGNNSGLVTSSNILIREGIVVLDSANAFGLNNSIATSVGQTAKNSVPSVAALLATSGNTVTALLTTSFNNQAPAQISQFGLYGTGAVTFSGGLRMVTTSSVGSPVPAVYLTASSGGVATFSGSVFDNGTGSQKSTVVVSGGGRVILSSSSNTYASGTNVNSGTVLSVKNSAGSGTGTGAVKIGYAANSVTGGSTTLNSGAVTVTSTAGLSVGQEISGSGIPAGSVIVAINSGTDLIISQRATATATGVAISALSSTGVLGGNGIIAPTGANGITVFSGSSVYPGSGEVVSQALRLDGGSTSAALLTMLSGASFTFNLGPANASDQIKFLNYLAGDLSLSANALNFSNAQAGTFKLFEFYSDAGTSVTASGISSGLVLGTGLSGFTTTLQYNTNDISLVVSAVPEPSTFGLILGVVSLTFVVSRRRRANAVSA
jgi:autotransporter-associated beta strand protein